MKKEMKIAIIAGVSVLAVVGIIFLFTRKSGNGGVFNINNEPKLKIKESETKNIKFTDFDNGLVKMKVPEGWKVDVVGDYIHYTIKAYDPNSPSRQLFFNLKTEGYNKSEDAKNWQKKYYPNDMFAKNPVIAEKTTEGFYKIFSELGPVNNTAAFTFPVIDNFTVIDNLGKATLGGDVLRATFKDKDGKEAEGLFSAYVYDAGPYYVTENFLSGKKIDIYFLSVYDALILSAPKDEFIEWEDTLNTMASSLEFTDTFLNGFNAQQDAVMKNFQNIRSICNQISDGIMDSWEKRSKSYDIMSQKQSDATLGYERVYNTDTGEIYKAYNGFTDDYDGKKYKAITDDMYTEKTSGYIEK